VKLSAGPRGDGCLASPPRLEAPPPDPSRKCGRGVCRCGLENHDRQV
jgi:hypothetical protein